MVQSSEEVAKAPSIGAGGQEAQAALQTDRAGRASWQEAAAPCCLLLQGCKVLLKEAAS
jgi:hypothetical protein